MANSHGGSMTLATPMLRTGSISFPGRTSSSTIARQRGNFRPISRFFAETRTLWWLIPSCWRRRSNPGSTFTSKATRSREGGAPLDYPDLLANWKQNFFGWNAADFGWGADRTQNILWRLENGELDGVNPKVVVLLAGTNNVGALSDPGGALAQSRRRDPRSAGDLCM